MLLKINLQNAHYIFYASLSHNTNFCKISKNNSSPSELSCKQRADSFSYRANKNRRRRFEFWMYTLRFIHGRDHKLKLTKQFHTWPEHSRHLSIPSETSLSRNSSPPPPSGDESFGSPLNPFKCACQLALRVDRSFTFVHWDCFSSTQQKMRARISCVLDDMFLNR